MAIRAKILQSWRSPGGSRNLREGEIRDLPFDLAARLESEGIVERLGVPRREPRPEEPRDPGPEEFAVPVQHWHTGGGWYALPGLDRKVRREEAEEILAKRRRGTVEIDEEG